MRREIAAGCGLSGCTSAPTVEPDETAHSRDETPLAGLEQVVRAVAAEQVVRAQVVGSSLDRVDETLEERSLEHGADVELRHPAGDRRLDGLGRKARSTVHRQRHVYAPVNRREAVEVDGSRASLQHVDVPEGDREAVDARRCDEGRRLVGVGERSLGFVDLTPRGVGQATELTLHGDAVLVGDTDERTDLLDSASGRFPASVHHQRGEACVEPAKRLLERVRLVQQKARGNAGSLDNRAPETAERLDPAVIEPGAVDEQAAESEDDRCTLSLSRLGNGFERVAVPRLEVADRVSAGTRIGEQLRQRDERHCLTTEALPASTTGAPR